MPRAPVVAPLLAMAVLSACLAAPDDREVRCEDPGVALLSTDKAYPDLPILYWARNNLSVAASINVSAHPFFNGVDDPLPPPKPAYANPNETLAPGAARFGLFLYRAPENLALSSHGLRVNVTRQAAPLSESERCRATTVSKWIGLSGEDQQGGTPVQPGAGVLVRTAGFWHNGTSFYTNLDRVNNDTVIPKAGWYEYEGRAPLKVYVYNQSRDEIPQRYRDAGFLTTIEGFNGALKTMGTGSARVAELAPEKAYTKPQYAGNATSPRHSLYGDALLFFIDAYEVVTVPCPLPAGPFCELPAAPPIGFANPIPS